MAIRSLLAALALFVTVAGLSGCGVRLNLSSKSMSTENSTLYDTQVEYTHSWNGVSYSNQEMRALLAQAQMSNTHTRVILGTLTTRDGGYVQDAGNVECGSKVFAVTTIHSHRDLPTTDDRVRQLLKQLGKSCT